MYKKQHFHFVGINGIGMSGIAKILHKQGHIISGCDLGLDTTNIQELIDVGCKISHEHNATICNNPSIDTVVYSSDVSFNNQELINARNRGIKTIQRAMALAEILQSKFSIGVAGSHGKTTTTSMLGHILNYAQTDPTIIVGGIMHNIKNNAHFGMGKYAVAETDESDRSHLLLPISMAILTSVDYEHANIYKNIQDVMNTFTQFINQLPDQAKAIVCLDDKNIQAMMSKITATTITYGTTNQVDIQAINIKLYPDYSTCTIIDNRTKKNLGIISVPMPSIYNVLNAVGAITAALELNIPFEIITKALTCFKGVDRRFTYKGNMSNSKIEIFDDYGHHPTEIYHSLITARRKAKNKLIVVFQPQRYTRTYHLWDEFIHTFQSADIDYLIITDIYPASETPIEGITGKRLVEEILKKHSSCKISYIPYQEDLLNIKNVIIKIAENQDLILFLGAGKVNKLAQQLL